MTQHAPERPAPDAAGPAGPVRVEVVRTDDPRARPLFDDLAREYGRRYGGTPEQIAQELLRYPAHEFDPPHGVLVLLSTPAAGLVAGGAYRRYDERTAELKRIWTRGDQRGLGWGRRVLAELDARAVAAGYSRLYLTTGPRQPEARALYLRTGWRPLFDVTADPETIGPLAFEKDLPACPPVAREGPSA